MTDDLRLDPNDVQELIRIVATVVTNRELLRPRVRVICEVYDSTPQGHPFTVVVTPRIAEDG